MLSQILPPLLLGQGEKIPGESFDSRRGKKINAHGRTPKSVAMPELLLSSELVRWRRKEQNWAAEGTPSPQGSRNQNQRGGRAQMASPGEQSCAEARTLLSCGSSDGLLITHVPDLSSLGLLVEQSKTSQVF